MSSEEIKIKVMNTILEWMNFVDYNSNKRGSKYKNNIYIPYKKFYDHCLIREEVDVVIDFLKNNSFIYCPNRSDFIDLLLTDRSVNSGNEKLDELLTRRLTFITHPIDDYMYDVDSEIIMPGHWGEEQKDRLKEIKKERAEKKKIAIEYLDTIVILKPDIKKLKDYKGRLGEGLTIIKNSKLEFINGILYFKDKEIDFNRSPLQRDLINTIFKEPNKYWDYDEVWEDWKEKDFNKPKRKLYDTARAINNKVANKTTIEDFLDTGDMKRIRIDSKYLG